MSIQERAKALTDALAARFESECDREVAEEVAYQLAELDEASQLYRELVKRLGEPGRPRAEAAAMLREAADLLYGRAVIHAKDLRRPLEDLAAMLEEDLD